MGGSYETYGAIAALLGTMIVYTYDRLDDVFSSPPLHAVLSKLIFSAIVVYGLIGMQYPHLIWNSILMSCLVVFYTKSLPIVGHSIKNLFACSKTLFVPFMHVLWSLLTSQTNVRDWFVCVLMFLRFATITILMDIKDISEDRAKNIVTVPTLFGHRRALALCIAAHGALALLCAAKEYDGLFWFYRRRPVDFQLLSDGTPTNAMFPLWWMILIVATWHSSEMRFDGTPRIVITRRYVIMNVPMQVLFAYLAIFVHSKCHGSCRVSLKK